MSEYFSSDVPKENSAPRKTNSILKKNPIYSEPWENSRKQIEPTIPVEPNSPVDTKNIKAAAIRGDIDSESSDTSGVASEEKVADKTTRRRLSSVEYLVGCCLKNVHAG